MKPLEGRLYELGPGGVRLILERGEVAARTSPYGSTGVMNPQVSGDGVLLAATLSDVCNRESGACTPLEMWSVLRGAVSEEMGAGTLQLSRNGRWALLTPAVEFGPQQATLIDIHNGLRTAVPLGPIEPHSRKLASDGTVLVEKRSEFGAGTHEFALWKEGQLTPLDTDPDAHRVLMLSDDARVLILGGGSVGQGPLWAQRVAARNLDTGMQRRIFAGANDEDRVTILGLSNDGRYLLYGHTAVYPYLGLAYIADTSTGESIPLPLPEGETVADGTLNGSGSFAFLVTSKGRLLKMSRSSGAIEVLIAETPHIRSLTNLTPGSLNRMVGSTVGAVPEWEGRVFLDGRPLPLLGTKTGELTVQIPWEQRTGVVPFVMQNSSTSPFQQFQPAIVWSIFPGIEPLNPGVSNRYPIQLFRGDGTTLLQEPPKSGDTVHMLMTGLGPVQDPPLTFTPAPDTPNPIQGSIECTFHGNENSATAETIFAGLAPRAIGVYLVSLRLPDVRLGSRMPAITCQVTGPMGSQSTLIYGLGKG